MKGSRRKYLTAGIALTTASVIAVSPVAPPAQAVPDIRTASPTVQLAARPYDAYFEIFEPLAETPIIDQLNANKDLLDEAVASGVPADEAIEQFVDGPAEQFAVYLEVAVRQLPRVPGVALTGAVTSTMNETSWIVLQLIYAAVAKDGREVAYILAEAPARIAKAVLWGSGPAGGLLTWPRNVRENLARALVPRPWVPVPAEITETPEILASAAGQSTASPADQLSGSTVNLFARVLSTREAIADALDPDNAPAAVPSPASPAPAPVVTLDIADTTAEVVSETASEKTADKVQERESRKAEAEAINQRTAERPKPLKKIRDNIRESVADAREAAKTAADRFKGLRSDHRNNTTSSKNDSAATPSAGSDGGPNKDSDRGAGKDAA